MTTDVIVTGKNMQKSTYLLLLEYLKILLLFITLFLCRL